LTGRKNIMTTLARIVKIALVLAAALAALADLPASASAASAAGDRAAALRRDPFRRPVAETAGNAAAPEEWKPELRAILFDRQHPLVNIDGRILGVGESIQGYRLLRVEEREAVLNRNGKQLKLELDRTPSQ
jgi:hypothetical protein